MKVEGEFAERVITFRMLFQVIRFWLLNVTMISFLGFI